MPCGSFGDLSTFSFYANKNVTTGEGGMVLTNDPQLNSELRYYRNLTFQDNQRFVHEHLGWNMRLSSIQAALGTSQIKRVKETVIRRRDIAEAYLSEIQDLEGLRFQSPEYLGNKNGYWVVGVLLVDHPKFATAKEAMAALQQAGVGTRPFFYPLHNQPLLKKYGYEVRNSLPVSEKLGQQGFYLPNGLGMSDEMLKNSVQLTKEILG
jgi:perosamine synthetase